MAASADGSGRSQGSQLSKSGAQRADDEGMFEDVKAKNMAPPRMFVPTALIEPTLLNSKRIKIRVTEGSVKHGGLFAANYILYKYEAAWVDRNRGVRTRQNRMSRRMLRTTACWE